MVQCESLLTEHRLKGEERANHLENWEWDVLGRRSNQCKGPETPRSQKPSVFEGQHGVSLAAAERTR